MSAIEGNIGPKVMSDNTANFGLANIDVDFELGDNAGANLVKAIAMCHNPEKFARKIEAARMAHVEGFIAAYDKAREAFPSWSDKQIYYLIGGKATTYEQAEVMTEVLGEAAEILESKNVEPQLPSPQKADAMLNGAMNSEEWARDYWAHLIAGELETPGVFSKATIDILDKMDMRDAGMFESYCERCVTLTRVGSNLRYPTLPYLRKGCLESLKPSIRMHYPMADIGRLVALGLVDSVSELATINGEYGRIEIQGELFVARPTIDKNKEIVERTFLYPLTDYGLELSNLCKIGTIDNMAEEVAAIFRDNGMILEKAE